MASSPPARRGRRRWRNAVLLGVLTLVVAMTCVVVARRPVSRWALQQGLALLGIEQAVFRVEDVGPRGMRIGDVVVGAADLTIEQLEARYTLAGLYAGRLEALAIRGLRLRGSLGEDGLRFGALDALFSTAPGAASPAPVAAVDTSERGLAVLPTDRLEIAGARVEVETPEGPAVASIDLELDEHGEGAFTLTTSELRALESSLAVQLAPFSLAGRAVLGSGRRELELAPAPFSVLLGESAGVSRVEGVLPSAKLFFGPDPAQPLRVQTTGGSLRLPELGLELAGLAADLEIEADARPQGELRLESIRDTSPDSRFPPLHLVAELAPADRGIDFDARLAAAGERLRLRARGSLDLESLDAAADLELAPMVFGPHHTKPIHLVPALASVLADVTGVVEGRGRVVVRAGEPSGDLEVGLRDLSLSSGGARIECINALLRFEGPWPPRTPGGQQLSMARLDIGLELTDGLLSYRVDRDGVLQLDSAEWQFFGGRVVTGGRFDPRASEQTLLLAVDGVQLEQLLDYVAVDGLRGSGSIGGRLPIVQRGDVIEIRGGVLTAGAEGGWLRYRPAGRSGLASFGVTELDDLSRALESFRYDRLVVRVDGDTRGEVLLAVHLAGANPDYRDGQPYEFNLNVDARLSDVLRGGALVYEIPQRIERKLGEAFGQAPPPPPGDPCARNRSALDADTGPAYAGLGPARAGVGQARAGKEQP